ncbi:MAG TPA: Smr/MutS family protein, partial [Geobacteraceae bacterium]
ALKGVKLAPGTTPAKPQPPPPPKPAPTAEEDALFLRAMMDVRRLNAKAAPEAGGKQPAPPPQPRRIDEEERRQFLDALDKLHLDVTFSDELPDDVEPLRPLPVNRMRQLRRGAIRIDYELDLHGLTRDEALENLVAFITGAYNRGQKGVLVITGKGNHSPEEPVLQAAVAGWLRGPGKGMVAEFAPAPRQMGGGGAFVVFLREKKVLPAEK